MKVNKKVILFLITLLLRIAVVFGLIALIAFLLWAFLYWLLY